MNTVSVAKKINFGSGGLPVILGPCVIESRDFILSVADAIFKITNKLGIEVIFKSSFDKANRTSIGGFRGLGREEGLKILAEVKNNFGFPLITDIHNEEDASEVAEVADILQIPAFLCRQTDILVAAGSTKKPVLVKKGQFLHPSDMKYCRDKIGHDQVVFCERGACFGYRDLVVDFRSLKIMRDLGSPVVFDVTHSVQSMGGAGGKSSGSREYVPHLARAAVAFGIDGLFLETHPDPDNAPSDGPNMIPLDQLEKLLSDIKVLHELSLATR